MAYFQSYWYINWKENTYMRLIIGIQLTICDWNNNAIINKLRPQKKIELAKTKPREYFYRNDSEVHGPLLEDDGRWPLGDGAVGAQCFDLAAADRLGTRFSWYDVALCNFFIKYSVVVEIGSNISKIK